MLLDNVPFVFMQVLHHFQMHVLYYFKWLSLKEHFSVHVIIELQCLLDATE